MGLLDFLRRRRLPLRFVYSDDYWMVPFGRHVFPVRKYRLIYEKLLALGAGKEHFLKPEPAAEENLLLVHTAKYLKKLSSGALSPAEVQALEIPFSPELHRFFILQVGGTVQTARQALRDGICVHLGGGFHHAFPDHGEGFCVLNDVAVAVEVLRREGRVGRAMIVDCDVHQGNGTAAVFAGRDGVFTFSIHQMDVYPADKPSSTLDVGLWAGDGDEAYLAALGAHIPRIYREFGPEIVVFLAGADPLAGDQLGGLLLSEKGMAARDRIVIGEARRLGLPVAVVLAGGYGREVESTVAAHLNTIKTAAAALRKTPGPRDRAGVRGAFPRKST
ncbi:MAG: histone deacetylase [Candidatus Aminicenantes bacterium]|nr:histone deacetylase [Candidatus Aminicenantes bacterium]